MHLHRGRVSRRPARRSAAPAATDNSSAIDHRVRSIATRGARRRASRRMHGRRCIDCRAHGRSARTAWSSRRSARRPRPACPGRWRRRRRPPFPVGRPAGSRNRRVGAPRTGRGCRARPGRGHRRLTRCVGPRRPTRNGASRSGPPPGWPKTAPRPPRAVSPMANGGRSRPGTLQEREIAGRVERDGSRVHRGAVGPLELGRAFAGDDVCVRGDEVRADDEAGAFLDAVTGAADDFHRRAGRPLRGRRAEARCGRRRTEDRCRLQGIEHLGKVLSDEASQRPRRVGRRGKDVVDGTHDSRGPGLLGGPVRHVGHGRRQDPHRDQHPEHTGDGRRPQRRTSPNFSATPCEDARR